MSVFVRYLVSEGIVPDDQYMTEYTIDNDIVTYVRRSQKGGVSYDDLGDISKDAYVSLDRTVVDAGFFKMLERYGRGDGFGDKPTAELSNRIEGKNKTIIFRPYPEELTPGNVQKVIFTVRNITLSIK